MQHPNHGQFAICVSLCLALVAAVPVLAEDMQTAAATGEDSGENAPAGPFYRDLMQTLALAPAGDNWLGYPLVTYVNFRAAEQAAGATTPPSGPALAKLDRAAFDRWAIAMSRIKVAPFVLDGELGREKLARAIPEVTSLFQGLPKVLGIDWFTIDRAISFGGPRYPVVAMESWSATVDASAVLSALESHQFERDESAGFPFWTRFAPDEIRPEAVLPSDISGGHFSDPFGIADGRAAGVALLPQALIGSADWRAVKADLAGLGEKNSLADDAAIAAAAHAMTAADFADSVLVQAVFAVARFDAANVARAMLGQFASDSQIATMQAMLARQKKLACYDLVALADLQDGDDEVALVIAVYPDGGEARNAAAIVAARFDYFRHDFMMNTPLLAMVGGTATPKAVLADSGYGAAVAVLRTTPKPEPDVSQMRPGRMFQFLLEGFHSGQFDPLVCD